MRLMVISEGRYSMVSTNSAPQFFFWNNFMSEDVSYRDLCLVKKSVQHLLPSSRKPQNTAISGRSYILD